MKSITKFEPIDPRTFNGIICCFTPVARVVARFSEVDLSRGAGVIDSTTKCLWTKGGRRIEIWYQHGAYGASCSRDIDPDAPASKE